AAAGLDRYRPHRQRASRGTRPERARPCAHARGPLGRSGRLRGHHDHPGRSWLAVHHRYRHSGGRRLYHPGLRRPMTKTHRLDPTPETVHWGYLDAKIPARMEVQSGDTVVVDTVSGWQEVAPDPGLYSPAHAEIIGNLKPVMGPHILTG